MKKQWEEEEKKAKEEEKKAREEEEEEIRMMNDAEKLIKKKEKDQEAAFQKCLEDCEKEQKVLEAKREKLRTEQLMWKKEREEKKLLSSPSRAASNDKTIVDKEGWQEKKSVSAKKIENKFVYTKAQSRVIGQEQLCPKIMKKMKFWTFWTFLKI